MKEYYSSRDYLRSVLPHDTAPSIGIVCGSGLGKLCELITDPISISYKDIPGFVQSTVPGHDGKLVFGHLGRRYVVCMVGRFHSYEGYSVRQTTFPIRIMALLGIELLIVTNAAGALNSTYKIGDIMCICDHIAIPLMAGNNPLVGANQDEFGPRFFACSDIYPRALRKHALQTANTLGIIQKTHEGVYGYVSGPQYETRAECRMLSQLGVDAVGMSTVPEVLVAKHAGLNVLGFTLITNMSILQPELSVKDEIQGGGCVETQKQVQEDVTHASHAEVLSSSKEFAQDLLHLVRDVVIHLDAIE